MITLEDLYYDNISPHERYIKRGTRGDKLVKLICKNEDDVVTGRNQVRGLTTAAGLWACACIGLAIGIGFIDGAIVAVILAMFTFNVLNRVDGWIHKYAKIFDLYIEFATNKSVSEFVNEMHARNIKISSFELGKSKIKGEGPNALICIELKERGQRDKIMYEIRKMNCVRYVEEY